MDPDLGLKSLTILVNMFLCTCFCVHWFNIHWHFIPKVNKLEDFFLVYGLYS